MKKPVPSTSSLRPFNQAQWAMAAMEADLESLQNWQAQGFLGPTVDNAFLYSACKLGLTMMEHALDIALFSGQGAYALALMDLAPSPFPRNFNKDHRLRSANSYYRSPLEMSVAMKVEEDTFQRVVERLMNKGYCLDTDWVKQSPLELAIDTDQPERVRFLLQQGAAMKAASQPLSPLFLSAKRGFPAVTRVLLEAGCDANAWEEVIFDGHLFTPLMCAAEAWEKSEDADARATVATLLQHGADPDAEVMDTQRDRLVRVRTFLLREVEAAFEEEVARAQQIRLDRSLPASRPVTATKPRF